MYELRKRILSQIIDLLDGIGSPLGVPFSIWFMGVGSLLLLVVGVVKCVKYLHVDDKPHGGVAMMIGIFGVVCSLIALAKYLTMGE